MKNDLILPVPAAVLEQHGIWLGKTGAGKSSSMRAVVEHLLGQKHRLCVVDPKGDWYGLKLAADGKSAGYPVILFGDFKEPSAADVPINDRSGKAVAELIASGNRPCVIGMRGWSNAAQARFWIDFAAALFNSNLTGGLKLFVDEVQNFAPKERTGVGDENLALAWTKRLLAEGRGLGLTVFCGSQRPASVHNGVLTQCETLVAMRVLHTSDRQAVEAWIKGCGDKAVGATVLDGLAGLKRGEAFVWSPEAGFGPERVAFPLFGTFDSFAPPQQQRKVSGAAWAGVDLDEVKAKLAAVIEEAKANDPKALREEVARLKREVKVLQDSPAIIKGRVVTETKEVPVFSEADRKLLVKAQELFAEVNRSQGELAKAAQLMADPLNRLASMAAGQLGQSVRNLSGEVVATVFMGSERAMPTALPRAIIPRPHEGPGDALVTGGVRRMLVALAQRSPLTLKQLGVRATLASKGGTFSTYLGKLRSNGWIEAAGGGVQITEEGRAALGDYTPLPEGRELLNHWLAELGQSGAGRMLRVLADNYPNPMTKAELGAASNIASDGGTFSTYLGKLRTLELVEGKTELRAAAEFFE